MEHPPFGSEIELEAALTTPSDSLIRDLSSMKGDLAILGAGGKMGPTLSILARRALDAAGRKNDQVYAVSRFGDAAIRTHLTDHGVNVVPYDLVMNDDLSDLPDAAHVIFMVGAKFGASSNSSWAWQVNAALPDRIARRYSTSSIASLSTGNVYPFTTAASGGATETTPLDPIGEYAQSCLGRERIFEFAAQERGTPVSIIRLNYAVDLRYGVLADIGLAVKAKEPISIATGHVNVVWQGYANEVILRSLTHASPEVFHINLTGPELLSVEDLAHQFGELLSEDVHIVDEPQPVALLSNANLCMELFDEPSVDAESLVRLQADWILRGLPMTGKPTKWAVRDGKF